MNGPSSPPSTLIAAPTSSGSEVRDPARDTADKMIEVEGTRVTRDVGWGPGAALPAGGEHSAYRPLLAGPGNSPSPSLSRTSFWRQSQLTNSQRAVTGRKPPMFCHGEGPGASKVTWRSLPLLGYSGCVRAFLSLDTH